MNEPLRWGRWELEEETLELVWRYRPGQKLAGDYEIDLERCRNAVDMLDWLAQLAGKAWCSPEDLGHLLLALDELFDLQGTVCGTWAKPAARDLEIEEVRALVLGARAAGKGGARFALDLEQRRHRHAEDLEEK